MPVLEPLPPPIASLPAPSDEPEETVRGLHLLAERVISPAREHATGLAADDRRAAIDAFFATCRAALVTGVADAPGPEQR